MIVGIDTDVLVHWAMSGTQHHGVVRMWLARELRGGAQLGLCPQVIHEFLHVVTDARRFDHPLEMAQATGLARELWHGKEVERLLPTASVVPRALELLETLRLGRKRILDTSFAALLEGAGVARIATLNVGDFEVFPFLDVVDPTHRAPSRRRSRAPSP